MGMCWFCGICSRDRRLRQRMLRESSLSSLSSPELSLAWLEELTGGIIRVLCSGEPSISSRSITATCLNSQLSLVTPVDMLPTPVSDPKPFSFSPLALPYHASCPYLASYLNLT
jgi:hypothetical protein